MLRLDYKPLKTKFPEFFCHKIDFTGINVDLRAHARPPPGPRFQAPADCPARSRSGSGGLQDPVGAVFAVIAPVPELLAGG